MASRARPRALLSLSAAGAGGLAAVAVVQRRGALRKTDRRAKRWMETRRRPALKRVARVGSWAGKWGVLVPVSVAVGVVVARRSGLAAGAALPAAAIASTVLQKTMKPLYGRRRPLRARRDGKRDGSFPSGHATGSVAVGGTAAYLLVREYGVPATAVIPAALLFPLLAAGSKLYDERHFFSDLLGGAAGGLAIGAAACALYEGARNRSPRR